MRATLIMLMATLMVVFSGWGLAQSKKPDSESLLARLSYDRTSVVWSDGEGPSKICLALYRSGRYEVLKDTQKDTEFLEGELSPSQLSRVSSMLESLDFQTHAAIIVRQESESFEAEFYRSGRTKHYIWVDPDHQRPFPQSAISVVNWLRNFKAQGASPLNLGEFSEQRVCPSGPPLQPLTACSSRGPTLRGD